MGTLCSTVLLHTYIQTYIHTYVYGLDRLHLFVLGIVILMALINQGLLSRGIILLRWQVLFLGSIFGYVSAVLIFLRMRYYDYFKDIVLKWWFIITI